ncbi:FAD-binding oxidoreductase [Caballeronia sordidicola]|uniref:nitric oxide dioxygenase n=1 Tax=Caballeronia sordidicola TaxID=196367 RepID=A0A226X711_CABSO|nr:FAD-binding oxidoreductase [Caballeronia sordidicola]OXC79275.1 Flavohemoprotein (Hemoglobin-like protein) (Flavohemoglobin) (Nitric oxide dioxygenase) [Caballeronia sordidicola]
MTGSVTSVPASSGFERAFERFRVARRTQESQSIISFELVPIDSKRSLAFIAGQFVAVRLTLPDGESLLSHYSLSGDPADTTHWRISVKLESAPPGRGSTHLHQNIEVGDELELAGPAGAFVCAEGNERPVILMSGGVGVTPHVSMLHRLVRASARRVHVVHACENSTMHAFGDEISMLAAARGDVHVHVCYRHPLAADDERGVYQSEGLLTKATLQSLLPLDDYEVYLCGPPGFMQANWRLLRELGVSRERIHYEFFGPATVLEDDSADTPGTVITKPLVTPLAAAPGSAVTVRFQPQGDLLPWDPSCYSLLEMAERAGYTPAFNCRAGICNACLTPVLSGRVEYFEEPLIPPPDGELLLCCARPVTPITLALQPSCA